MNLRDLFNQHKWHTGDLGVLTVVIRHRGAPADEKRVSGAEILEIAASGLTVRSDEDEAGVYIPFHRVLRVIAPEGVLFEKEPP